jgi:hypothetical protein
VGSAWSPHPEAGSCRYLTSSTRSPTSPCPIEPVLDVSRVVRDRARQPARLHPDREGRPTRSALATSPPEARAYPLSVPRRVRCLAATGSQARCASYVCQAFAVSSNTHRRDGEVVNREERPAASHLQDEGLLREALVVHGTTVARWMQQRSLSRSDRRPSSERSSSSGQRHRPTDRSEQAPRALRPSTSSTRRMPRAGIEPATPALGEPRSIH